MQSIIRFFHHHHTHKNLSIFFIIFAKKTTLECTGSQTPVIVVIFPYIFPSHQRLWRRLRYRLDSAVAWSSVGASSSSSSSSASSSAASGSQQRDQEKEKEKEMEKEKESGKRKKKKSSQGEDVGNTNHVRGMDASSSSSFREPAIVICASAFGVERARSLPATFQMVRWLSRLFPFRL